MFLATFVKIIGICTEKDGIQKKNQPEQMKIQN